MLVLLLTTKIVQSKVTYTTAVCDNILYDKKIIIFVFLFEVIFISRVIFKLSIGTWRLLPLNVSAAWKVRVSFYV